MTARAGLLVAVAAVLVTGCGKSPPPLVAAEGVITLDGQPLPRSTIMLFPTFKGFGSDLIAIATSDDDGRFRLECGVGQGACVGVYRATVTETPVPPELMNNAPDGDLKIREFYAALPNRPIPTKFGDLPQTPVQVEIVEGKTSYDIALKR